MTPGEVLSRLFDALVDVLRPLLKPLGGSERLVVVDDGSGLAVHRVRRGQAEAVPLPLSPRMARAAAQATVELRLPPDRLIARTLQLPAAGRDYLDAIIEHRLDRLTPWRPDRLLYGFSAGSHPAEDGTMTVEFLATSEEIAGESIARVGQIGLVPTVLGSAGEPVDAPLPLDLFRGSRDVGRRRMRRTAGLILVAVMLLVVPATAILSTLAYLAETRLSELDERLLTRRKVLAAATGVGDAQSRDIAMIKAKTADTAMMLLIDRIAARLPDDTHLKELEVDGERIRLNGLSTAAPQLIALLEADDWLEDVRFTAPVTRDDAGRDGFEIGAVWTGRRALAAGAEATP